MTRQPLLWALATAGMAASGDKGRRAALRGTGCYLVGATVGNLPKPLFGRAQPRHRWARKPQVIRGSFPSGHACAEVAFVFGAAQEAPLAFLPFGTMAMLAHLSLTRDGKHYVTDTLVGGTMGVLIAAYAGRRWPTDVTRRIGLNRRSAAV
jgi:membrane-associated phospholipid phosphatase